MTAEKLAEIRKRAEAATPGPWYHDPTSGNSSRFNWLHYVDDNDLPFIREARTDIPALLDEVERLREALEKIEDLMPLHERERREIARVALEGK